MERFSIANTEKKTIKAVKDYTELNSNLTVFKTHNGLRQGKLHLVIGSSGSGKSTFVRSLIIDQLRSHQEKILLYLSEETVDDLKGEMSEVEHSFHGGSNLFVFSELCGEIQDTEYLCRKLIEHITEENIRIFIFDNITTSKLYNDMTPRDQFEFVTHLKTICSTNNVVFVLIAHTNAQVSDNSTRMINETDIRGSKSIVNLCEFMYILQRFQIKEHFYPTIRTIKHRSQSPKHKLFHLVYDEGQRIYKQTNPVDFELFKEAYEKRNKL